MPELLTERQK